MLNLKARLETMAFNAKATAGQIGVGIHNATYNKPIFRVLSNKSGEVIDDEEVKCNITEEELEDINESPTVDETSTDEKSEDSSETDKKSEKAEEKPEEVKDEKSEILNEKTEEATPVENVDEELQKIATDQVFNKSATNFINDVASEISAAMQDNSISQNAKQNLVNNLKSAIDKASSEYLTKSKKQKKSA